MNDSQVMVVPVYRVLANGGAAAAEGVGGKQARTLHLTLLATPLLVEAGEDTPAGAFPLSRWPQKMAERMGAANAGLNMKVSRPAPTAQDEGLPNPAEVPIRPGRQDAYADRDAWEMITTLWADTLGRGDETLWRDLAKDIRQSLSGGKRTVNLEAVPLSELSEDQLHLDGALKGPRAVAETVDHISGVISVRQADFAVAEQTLRAARVAVKAFGSPAAITDDTQEELDGSDTREITDEKAFRKEAFCRYKRLIRNTQAQRVRSQKLFDIMAQVINGAAPSKKLLDALDAGPVEPLVPVPETRVRYEVRGDRVCGTAPRYDSHDYFTWPQRPDELHAESQQARPGGPVSTPLPKIPTDYDRPEKGSKEHQGLGRARSLFLAFQSDPTLARLFCLTFDCEVDEAILRRASDPDELLLHLAPSDNPHLADAGAGIPVVATAACLKAARVDDPHVRFWPASIFRERKEQGVLPKELEALIEQEDGIFRGDGKRVLSEHRRYEVTGLDFRQSIDAKGEDRDRGQSMHSGGFSIIDRGRADTIVRDLALLNRAQKQIKHCQAFGAVDADWLVLYAEELTIGRKVDVALVVDKKPLSWRSLMRRTVNFDFGEEDKAIEALLRRLIQGVGADANRLGEEIAFQLTARSIPFAQTTKPGRVEAIAEESIFVWTGAPVAVDVNAGVTNAPSPLPFSRTLDLPNQRTDSTLCPPPLRYSQPYVFRLRACFVGGGSPSIEEADAALEPAAIPAPIEPNPTASVLPRRFLRHEGIGAPILLLPRHRAETRWGVMGHEQADQAIIRSIDPGKPPLEPEADDGDGQFQAEVGGVYLGLKRRASPTETIRIFVPPEVTPAILERHGLLDRRAHETVLVGGLKDAIFKPQPRPKPQPRQKSGTRTAPLREFTGFPIVVTRRLDGLDPDGAIDERKYFVPGDKEEPDRGGIPVFTPGHRDPAQEGETGYLPDPAAQVYCVRARIRGSDRYLAGSILIDAYAGGNYPDALPLAVVVMREQDGKPPKAHPATIHDIATKVLEPQPFDAGAGFSKSKGGSVSRVLRLDIRLAAHEDYDLEVSCLPKVETLKQHFAVAETIAVQMAATGANWLNDLNKADPADPVFPVVTDGTCSGVGGSAAPCAEALTGVAGALFTVMSEKWPLEEIAAVRTLRVCHASNLPTERASWRPGDPVVYRPSTGENTTRNVDPWSNFKEEDRANEGGVDALIAAAVELDLAEVGGFDIIAKTAGVDGQALDDKQRGRSPLSKRSGRWPRIIGPDGETAYAPAKSVYGFSVAENGVVTLPRSEVTLLSVRNLPTHGAAGGKIEGEKSDDGGVRLFGPVANPRRTAIALGPLFANAFAGKSIRQAIALPDGKKNSSDRRKRLIALARPHAFKDTLARHVELSIATTSRHASDFETAPLYVDEKETPQNLFRRQSLLMRDQRIVSTDVRTVWIKSTVRPEACDARRPEPAFVLRRESKLLPSGAVENTVTRRALSRIWIGRGWFSSGEGERLGMVLWPPGYGKLQDTDVEKDEVPIPGRPGRVAIPDFQDGDLGDGGAFVTRWGGDPTREDRVQQSGFLIPPNAFAEFDLIGKDKAETNPHRPAYVPLARMPVPKRAGAEAAPVDYLSVSLLTFEPCFDPDREEWFVDIDLSAKYSAEPFVRFGLVRYQEHSILPELKVSEPVSVMMQILPERTVSVTRHKPLPQAMVEELDIRVEGPAGTAIKPIVITPGMADDVDPTEWRERSKTLDRPHMLFTLFSEGSDDGVFTRSPVNEGFRAPAEISFDGSGAGKLVANLIWRTTVRLTPDEVDELLGRTLIVHVEEVDRRMPASYRHEPVTLKTMLDASTFVDSGPRFSARVPIRMSPDQGK